MNGKILVFSLLSLLTATSYAKAGALDVFNKVGNIAQALSDTQRTLAGGKPEGPGAIGGISKRSSGGHAVVHAGRHK